MLLLQSVISGEAYARLRLVTRIQRRPTQDLKAEYEAEQAEKEAERERREIARNQK